MAKCTDCGKFKAAAYNGDYTENSIEISDDGVVSAEYEFTLGCEDCGCDMLTGTITFENNDATEGVTAFMLLHDEDAKIAEVRENALDKYLDDNKLRMAWDGDNLNVEEKAGLNEAMDTAEADYNERREAEVKEAFFVAKEANGWQRSQVEIECADEIDRLMDNLGEHEFEIEETSVDVYEDYECKNKIWVLEVQCKITDAKHPEWEGEEITLKDSIRQSEMDEC